jgi:predicted PurR-regulated permease PerM
VAFGSPRAPGGRPQPSNSLAHPAGADVARRGSRPQPGVARPEADLADTARVPTAEEPCDPTPLAQELPDMPLPTDPRLVVQFGLFMLALLAALYVAAEIVLPVVLAFVLKLLLQPVMRRLERLHVPRSIAAVLVLLAFLGIIFGFFAVLYVPTGEWIARLPRLVPQIGERLAFLREPIEGVRNFLRFADNLAQIDPTATTVIVPEGAAAVGAADPASPSLSAALFSGTADFALGLFTTILLVFYLLIAGDTFLRRLVELLPDFKDKRQAVDISQQVERDISGYLVTITGMNLGVGVATALVMWACGIEDPIMWGAMAFLLNYVPIAGPLVGIGIILLVGLGTFGDIWEALLPALGYLAIHLLEGEFVTPMVLARRFTLNPVLVILTLVFWYWMWGIPGAIISVPVLAIAKIVCDRIRPLAALGHFLGNEPPQPRGGQAG